MNATQKLQLKIESFYSDWVAADRVAADRVKAERALASRRWAMARSSSPTLRAMAAEMSSRAASLVTPHSVTASVRRMSRKRLEASHIAAGIAKWGERERHGLRRQAANKTLETLRKEEGLRLAYAAQLSRDDEKIVLRLLTPAKKLQYQARRARGLF